MAHSTENAPVWDIIARLRSELTMERLHQEIDAHIDTALQSASLPEDPVNTQQFRQVLILLTQKLFLEGSRCPQVLSQEAALDEALAMIMRHYPSSGGDGCTEALLDATNQQGPGPQRIAQFLADVMKARERRAYVVDVVIRICDPTDFRLRCRLVQVLQQTEPHLFPSDLGTLSVQELARAALRLVMSDSDLPSEDLRALDWLGG